MTDIWRSFVAQRISHHLGYFVLFHGCTVWQERYADGLQGDFCDEVFGYVNNHAIRTALMNLDFGQDTDICQLLAQCYQCLMQHGWVGKDEEPMLECWIRSLRSLGVV